MWVSIPIKGEKLHTWCKWFGLADEYGLPGDMNLSSHGIALTKKSTTDLIGASCCDEDTKV
jgi:hypothetical protein